MGHLTAVGRNEPRARGTRESQTGISGDEIRKKVKQREGTERTRLNCTEWWGIAVLASSLSRSRLNLQAQTNSMGQSPP
jgi:hypothetical protein